jgi:hypothetical protein
MLRLQRVRHALGHLSDGKGPIVTDHVPATEELDPAIERRIAVGLFNRVWELLALPDRTPAQVDEMIHSAHASRLHWSRVGGAVNLDRGEWQCSRVYAVLGRAEPALWHARRTLEICQTEGIGDWDLAFAYEALARASSVAGDRQDVERYLEAARAAAAEIAEDEDRELLLNDLETIG